MSIRDLQEGHSTEPVTTVTTFLPTWRPPCGPMIFAPMAASSKMDRGYHNLSKTISFRLFFMLTFSWNDPHVVYWKICLNQGSSRGRDVKFGIQIESDWPKMGQICDVFKISFSAFWLERGGGGSLTMICESIMRGIPWWHVWSGHVWIEDKDLSTWLIQSSHVTEGNFFVTVSLNIDTTWFYKHFSLLKLVPNGTNLGLFKISFSKF